MAAPKKRKPAEPAPRKQKAPAEARGRSSSHSANATLLSSVFGDRFGISAEEFEAVSNFAKLEAQQKTKISREIVQKQIIDMTESPNARFALAIAESQSLLKGYATLDDQHRAEIQRLIKQITDYLRDPTRKRPFNALMLASPGAGKSHFIEQVADTMKKERVQAVTFNMATMQSAEDMAQPIDELRNLKVNDKFPLLFLDEFDSDPARYAALLPLLWKGELQIGHRDLKLGKAVIVLAGSNPSLPKAMDESAKMRLDTDTGEGSAPTGKLIDLLSRINGGIINIPDLDLRTKDRDRRIDKVCIAVELAKARFGSDLVRIPRSLLRFIAHTSFRYGVRSIAHLIDLIESKSFDGQALKEEAMDLPITSEEALQDSSLKLHLLDRDQGFGIVNRWKQFSVDKAEVRVALALSLQPMLSRWFDVLYTHD